MCNNSKTCTKCGECKPLEEYNMSGRNGRREPRCRDCAKKAGAAYRERTRERERLRALEYSDKYPERRAYSNAKQRAKKKGVPFSISVDDIIIPTHCPVLGIELARCPGSKSGGDSSPSIDRIHPDLGYVPGNIEVISYRANRIKNNATAHALRAVADYYMNKES